MKETSTSYRKVTIFSSIIITLFTIEITLYFMSSFFYMGPGGQGQKIWRTLLHRHSDIPGLTYELVPDARSNSVYGLVRTNSYGMRDAEPLSSTDPGVIRIAAVGDSVTFGFLVKDNEAYPSALEAMIREKIGSSGNSIDVLNFGVGGYSTKDEVSVIEHKALPWKPDLILMGYVLNDPETDAIQPLNRHYAEWDWWWNIHIWRLIAQVKNRLEILFLGHGDYLTYLHWEKSEKWKTVEASFETIKGLTAELDIPVMLVIFPMFPEDSWASYAYEPLHRQISKAATAAGLDVLDLLDTYQDHPPTELWVRPNDSHPSVFAHALAASAIFTKIEADYAKVFARPEAQVQAPIATE